MPTREELMDELLARPPAGLGEAAGAGAARPAEAAEIPGIGAAMEQLLARPPAGAPGAPAPTPAGPSLPGGKMGLIEAVGKTRPEEVLPFVGGAFTMNRLQRVRDAIDRLEMQRQSIAARQEIEYWDSRLRVGAIDRAEFERQTADIPGRYPQADPRGPEDEAKLAGAQAVVDEFVRDEMERQIRGLTIPARIGEGVIQLLPYAIEFAATAGVAAGPKAAAGAVGKRLLRQYGTTALRRALIKSGTRGAAWIATAAMRTPLMATRVGAQAQRRMLSGEDPNFAFMTAAADVFIENLSEVTGEAIVGKAAKVLRAVPGVGRVAGRFGKALRWAWGRGGGSMKRFDDILARAGYHGILGEMSEERLGDAMRALFGTQTFGLSREDNTALNRLVAAVPNGDQLLVEAGIFATPLAARVGYMGLNRLAQSKSSSRADVAKALGIRPENLPPELQTKEGREAAIEEAQRDAVQEGAEAPEAYAHRVEGAEGVVRRGAEAPPGREGPPDEGYVDRGVAEPPAGIAGEEAAAAVPEAAAPAEVRRPEVAPRVTELEARIRHTRQQMEGLSHRSKRYRELKATLEDLQFALESERFKVAAGPAPAAPPVEAAPEAVGRVAPAKKPTWEMTLADFEGKTTPEWVKRPVVFPSTQPVAGTRMTQSAVNWRKVRPETVSGRLGIIYEAWQKHKAPATGFVSWDNLAKETGLAVEDMAAELKALDLQHRGKYVGRTVNRMGDNTSVKFKKRPPIAPVMFVGPKPAQPSAAEIAALRPARVPPGVHGGIVAQMMDTPEIDRTGWGAENTIVTPEQYKAAKADFMKRMGRAQVGIPVDALPAFKDIALYHFEAGARRFKAWAGRMVETFGERIRPHLRAFWNGDDFARLRKEVQKARRAGAVKTRVLDMFRWYKGEPLELTPAQLLKWTKTWEARGARQGYRAGQLELTAGHAELMEFAKNALPEDAYRQVAKVAEKIAKARTPAQRARVVKAINTMVTKMERSALEHELRDMQKRVKAAKLRPEFQATADALLGDIATHTHREATVRKATSLLEAAVADVIGEIPLRRVERAVEILKDLDRRQLKELSNDEIDVLLDALGKVLAQNQQKNEIIFGREARQLEDVQEAGVTRIGELRGRRDARGKVHLPYEGQKRQPRKRFRTILSTEQRTGEGILRRLFGKGHPLYEWFVEGFRSAREEMERLRLEAEEAVPALLEQAGVSPDELPQWSRYLGGGPLQQVMGWGVEAITIDLPSGRKWETTRGELFGFLDTLGRKKQRHHFFRHKQRGIIEEGDKAPTRLETGDIIAIEQSAEAEEVRRVGFTLRDWANQNLQPRVQEAYLRNNGRPMPMEDDFWPTHRWRGDEPADPNAARGRHAEAYLQDLSYFQPLKGGNRPFLIRDGFAEFFDYVNRATQYIAMSRWLNDARTILGRQASPLALAIQEGFRQGPEYYNFLTETLDDIEAMEPIRQTDLGRLVNQLTKNWHRGKLAGKLHIAASQPISYMALLNVGISGKHLVQAVRGNDAETRQEMYQWSAYLYHRVTGAGGYGIVSATEGAPAMARFFGLGDAILDRLALGAIHFADAKTIMAGWRACKAEAQEQGLEGDELMRATARRMVEAVDETQPSWGPMDTPQLIRRARGKPYRMLIPGLPFSSQRGKNINMLLNAITDYSQIPAEQRTPADFGRMTAKMANAVLLQAILLRGIRTGVKWGMRGAVVGLLVALGYRRRKDEPRWSWLRKSFDVLDSAVGNWILAGEGMRMGLGIAYTEVTAGIAQPEYRRAPKAAGAAIDEAYDAGLATAEAIRLTITGERYKQVPRWRKAPRAQAQAVLATNELLSSIFGIPTSAVNMMLRPALETMAPTHPQSQRQRAKKQAAIP